MGPETTFAIFRDAAVPSLPPVTERCGLLCGPDIQAFGAYSG